MKKLILITMLVGLMATPALAVPSFTLGADTPATGSLLASQPLITPYGTITFNGEIKIGSSDPDFTAAGAVGGTFNILYPGDQAAELFFDFDVISLTFVYGGGSSDIDIEARDALGNVVDSFYQASTGPGEPAGPITLSGSGIRSLFWEDTGIDEDYAALDNIEVTPLPAFTPDLVVDSMTIDKNPIMQPRGATISCTIKNQGDADATPTGYWLRVRLSVDNVYDESDTYVAGRQIPVNLAPGAQRTEEINFNSDSYNTGDFYLVAKIDEPDIVTESLENNNTKASDLVTIIPFTPHTVQGYVKYSTGQGFGGVQVNLTGDETQTDITQNDGWYNFDALADGNFTVTAVESGCTFTNNPQTAVVSGADVWLLDMIANCDPEETISKPGTPTGEINPVENISYTYTTSGAESNLGHTVEYQFDWGDGSFSSWSTSTSSSHSWSSTGERQITVTARCQTHTDKTNISDPLAITVIPDEPPPPAKLRLIIDTDPAVGDSDPDDGTAIIYAFQSPNLCTIEGITYGYGNFGNQIPEPDGITRGSDQMLEYYKLQLGKILQVLQEAGVIESPPPFYFYRGHKANQTWDACGYPGVTNEASDFLSNAVTGYPGEFTIVALGTLTNIATAMANHPGGPENFLYNCKDLWIIGGGIEKGNVVSCVDPLDLDSYSFLSAEWNIFRDVNAAEYVFKHAVQVQGEPKIKMVPLDATMRWLISSTNVNSLTEDTRIGRFLRFPLRWWINEDYSYDYRQIDWFENAAILFARGVNDGLNAFPPYDTIGMALVLEPNLATTVSDTNKIQVLANGTTVFTDDPCRGTVCIFYDYNEIDMNDTIMERWTKPEQPLENKLFFDCSESHYVIQYLSSLYAGPRNVSLDNGPYVSQLGYPYSEQYFHLPVGVAPYLLIDPSAKYRGRLTFDVNFPDDTYVTNVKLHLYCDNKLDKSNIDHRVNIYYCDPQENDALEFWNSANDPNNKYVDSNDIGTLQAWRKVDLGNKAVNHLQSLGDGGQFAILLAEDGDDHPCAWFDTSKDWKAYLEIDYDIMNIINFDDLAKLLNYWLLSCSGPEWCEGYDYDESGKVNFIDFAFFAEHWLKSAAQ